MNNLKTFTGIINGSKSFSFENNSDGYPTVLIVNSYFTGECVKLDLSLLTQRMLDTILVEEIETFEDENNEDEF